MKHITSLSLLTLTAAASFAQSAAAPSAFTVSGNVALTSDYVFRGLSLSDGESAIQGGFDISKTAIAGLTAGVFASSVETGTELDIYANYGFKVGAVDLSIGYINYQYSNTAPFANSSEVSLAATYVGVTVKASFGLDGAADYYEANYSYDLAAVAKGLSLGLHYGSDRTTKNDDYAIALSYPIAGLDTSVSFSGIQNGDSITAFTVKKSF